MSGLIFASISLMFYTVFAMVYSLGVSIQENHHFAKRSKYSADVQRTPD